MPPVSADEPDESSGEQNARPQPTEPQGSSAGRPSFRADGAAIPVLIAVADPSLESEIVAGLAGPRSRLTVVRRCVDLPDLLSAASAGTAVAAIASAGVRGLDQAALARLGSAGVAVVGLNDDVGPGSERTEVRLRQMGLRHVVAADHGPGLPARLAAAVETALADTERFPDRSSPIDGPDELMETGWAPDADAEPVPGRVIGVWGPTGAPGRTFLAWNLAGELAVTGARVLVIDADVYGGTLAQYAGVVDEAPGIVAACRAANVGALDANRLATLARALPGAGVDGGTVTVLTGISRPTRWPEVRPAALTTVLEHARLLADVVLVDTGFSLEQDEELSYDMTAPRRNGATLAALGVVDDLLVVGAADPVGLTRLIGGLGDLRQVLEDLGVDPRRHVVVNRARGGARERRQVSEALERHASMSVDGLLPLDVEVADRALLAGRSVTETAPKSALRKALADLAAELARGRLDAALHGAESAGSGRRPGRSRRRTPFYGR